MRGSKANNQSAFDVVGIALGTNTVAVNGSAPYRKGEYYRKEISVSNGSVPVWQSVSVAASGETTVNGNVFVPKTTENFGYELDGNLTSDGRWNYEWDGENRLKVMRSLLNSPAPERRLVFDYDAKGRRIRQTVWNDRDDNEGSEVSDVLYLYDGWNLMAELDALNSNARVRTYAWGLDLSGTMQGAGGVGGLLEVVCYGAATTNCFVAYDGNGNVTALLKADGSSLTAQYEYGPFGEVIRSTGPMAKANPFRFSTKYQDDESDLVYYGYRFYNGSMGRWLSRDPIEERGGENLFEFVQNDPLAYVDLFGLYKKKGHKIIVEKCEIVIVYGHQYKKDPWKFEFPEKCSAGGLVACWPDLSNGSISPDHGIGAPSHGDVGFWPAPNPNPRSREEMEDEHDLLQELNTTIENAKKKARKMNCCSQVTIRFIRAARFIIDRAIPDKPDDIVIYPPLPVPGKTAE